MTTPLPIPPTTEDPSTFDPRSDAFFLALLQYQQELDAFQAATVAAGRNRLHNNAFLINQRAVSGTVTLAAGAYGHDRWKAGGAGCTYTFATVNNLTTLTISAGSLVQVIEGSALQSGTHVLSWSGTAQGKIGAGSYAATGVTSTVTGGSNLSIEFGTGTLALPQFEPGATATATEHLGYGAHLVNCQRFYTVVTNHANYFVPFNSTGAAAYVALIPLFAFPVEMRAAPTMSYTYGTSSNLTGAPSVNVDKRGFSMYGVGTASGYGFLYPGTITASADL